MKTSVNKRSDKLLGFIAAGALIVAALVLSGCPSSVGGSGNGATTGSPSIDVGSFEDAGDFVKIIPPAAGIVGVEPAYTLPGTDDYWKGVFIKDRKVKLSPYLMGKTEVPYKLWKEVHDWATENGYKFANVGKKGSNDSGSDDEPVTTVSWRDCIVWCNAYTHKTNNAESKCVYRKSKTDSTVLKDATAKEGGEFICDNVYADMSKKGYRLPTEAEWEYAARWQGSNSTNAEQYGEVWLTKLNSASGAKKPIGFNDLTLPEGETWESLRDEVTRIAVYDEWWDGRSWKDQVPETTKTAEVGKKIANALGLYDMSGNVWEWCFDGYKNDPTENDVDYTSGGFVVDPLGAASGDFRVLRGGGWGDYAKSCVIGFQDCDKPDGCDDDLGFRLVSRP